MLGNGWFRFLAALPGSLPRLDTDSVAPAASTMRHLHPMEKACHACAAADLQTTDDCPHRCRKRRVPRHPATGHGSCGSPCARRYISLPCASRTSGGGFFLRCCPIRFPPWRSSGSLTAAPPRYFSDNPRARWHGARYRRGSPAGAAASSDPPRRARARGWCTPPPAAVRA